MARHFIDEADFLASIRPAGWETFAVPDASPMPRDAVSRVVLGEPVNAGHTIVLNAKDFDRFLAALDVTEPNEALEQAAQRHRERAS